MHKGLEDPLEVVGLEIADEAILLCLDEFMVCDAHLHCVINLLYLSLLIFFLCKRSMMLLML